MRISGNPAPESRFDRIPANHMVKGLFFTRLLDLVGDRLKTKSIPMLERPLLRRYLPFADYPQVDYSRLTVACAGELYPELPLREAMRRVARDDFQVYFSSRLGAVMLALLGDVRSSLLRFPDMFRTVLKGGRFSARELSDTAIELRLEDFYGWVDCYPVGTVEGLVLHHGAPVDIEVEISDDVLSATYVVHLPPR